MSTTFNEDITLNAKLTISSSDAAALDVAGGINAGSSNVGIIDTNGRIPAIASTYFASLSGANLTSLDAGQLSTGTIPVARFQNPLPALNASNLTNLSAPELTGALPALNASNLTNLSARRSPVRCLRSTPRT